MKNRMALGLPLAIVLFAAVAAAALRAGGQTSEAAMGARHRTAPVTATADKSRPQPTAPTATATTTGAHDSAGHEMAGPPGPQGRPVSAVEPTQQVFHELHADGRNALCGVCDTQYQSV